MPVPANIDIFNKVVAKSLLLLYDNFPCPIDLDPAFLVLDIGLEEKFETGSEKYEALVSSPKATIDFLVVEEFIRFNPDARRIGEATFPDAVLSAKGLSLLNQIPESVDERKDRRSYVDRMKSATGAGIKSVAPEIIGALVSGLLKGG